MTGRVRIRLDYGGVPTDASSPSSLKVGGQSRMSSAYLCTEYCVEPSCVYLFVIPDCLSFAR